MLLSSDLIMPRAASPLHQVRFGPFALDVRSGELCKGRSRLKVPDQSIEILKALLEQPGALVTRDQLRDRLWPLNTFVDFEHGLNAAINRLREALGDSADAPRFIETLPRRGYRFIGRIDEAVGVPATPESASRVPAGPEPVGGVIRSRRREPLAWLVAGGLGIALLVTIAVRIPSAPHSMSELTQFAISPPENAEFGESPQFAVSPSGRLLVFVAYSNGVGTLWLKSLATPTATQLPGTENASSPFWSPDSQFVGFFASRQLKKLRIGAAGPEVVCDAAAGRGGTWNSRDEIVFAPGTDTALLKVHASGGPSVPATTKDGVRKDTTHRNPAFLPDGKHFLFWAGGGATMDEIQIGSLDSKDAATSTGLRNVGLRAMYSSGHILFIKDGTLRAQPFDVAARHLTHVSFPIAENVTSFSGSGEAVLAYATSRVSTLTWLDRAGNVLGTVGQPAFMVALSPDDTRVATAYRGDIELIDLTRTASVRRFTTAQAQDFFPVWSPDGEKIVFASTRSGRYQIFMKPSDFSGQETLLLDDSAPPNHMIAPTDWSRDGAYIAYTKSGSHSTDIWIMPVSGSRAPFPFRTSAANEGRAHFSPNGNWVAFTSDESGSGLDVYVAPIPGPGPVHLVSDGGGTQPSWSSDGKEVFFIRRDGAFMSAQVETGPVFKTDVARKLFTVPVNVTVGLGNEFAVARDGKRFLVNVRPKPAPITYVLDWHALTTN